MSTLNKLLLTVSTNLGIYMQGRLPFMEPKKIFRANEVNRHCFKRVKAFIGTLTCIFLLKLKLSIL